MSWYNKNSMEPRTKKLTLEDVLSEQPFYEQPIRKTKSKKLRNQELLQVLPFYDDVGVLKRQRAFRNYAETYEVEAIDNRSLDDSLRLSKTSIKDLFNDLLRERRGFKFILNAKATFKNELMIMKLYIQQLFYFRSKSDNK